MKGFVLAGTFAVLGALWAPASASADYVSGYGYPCRVQYSAPPEGLIIVSSPTSGQYGSVSVSFYSAPECTGTFVRAVTVYSAGSNIQSYTGNATTYEEAPLLAIFAGLQRAAEAGERVFFTGYTWTVSSPWVMSGTQLVSLRFASY